MRRCLICNRELNTEPIFVLKNAPSSAQNLPGIEDLEMDEGIDLPLHKCECCGLVQLDVEPVDYYKDVIRAGSFNRTLRELRKAQYEKMIKKYHLENKKFVEIGSGRGEFLDVLKEFPVEVYGIENNKELVGIARDKGLNVTQDFLGEAEHILAGGPFDVFLSFNFLEHQPNPNGMIQGIYNNLKEDGYGLITVPSFEYILENNSYYELIRDHLAYYTAESLEYLLKKNGFEILEKDIINRDTLSFVVKKQKKKSVEDLKACYDVLNKQFSEYFELKRREGKKVAIWGASHQGFTLCSNLKLTDEVECIIDSAPFKQGKFAPASHIPIISPEDALKKNLNAIIIIAPGYTKEIAGIIERDFGENVEIMVVLTDKLQSYEEIDV